MPLPQSRRNIRIQNIARYRISGRLTDKQIADLVGITPQGLAFILKTPEYIDLENSLLEGRVSQMDEALAGDVEEIKNSFRVAVPVAARSLLEIVQQKRDLRASLAAAKEILDRDPDHILSPIRQVQPPAGSSGSAFNPEAAGAVITGMTSEAAKVNSQLANAQATPISSAQQPTTAVSAPTTDGVVTPPLPPSASTSPGTSSSSEVASGD